MFYPFEEELFLCYLGKIPKVQTCAPFDAGNLVDF